MSNLIFSQDNEKIVLVDGTIIEVDTGMFNDPVGFIITEDNQQKPSAHTKLQIVYKNNKPYGIRDSSGFLLFFTPVSKFPNQEERYRQEVMEQFALADYLLEALEKRNKCICSVEWAIDIHGNCSNCGKQKVHSG